jgi:hypothetical protein
MWNSIMPLGKYLQKEPLASTEMASTEQASTEQASTEQASTEHHAVDSIERHDDETQVNQDKKPDRR